MAFSHLWPSYPVISIKCFPWGANNNKQLLVNVLCQHVPFALLPFLSSQPMSTPSATTAPVGPYTGRCISVHVCVFVFLTCLITESWIRKGIGLMLIIAGAITVKSFGRCMAAKLQTVMILPDCLVLLVMKSFHVAFFFICQVILHFPLYCTKLVWIIIQVILSLMFSDSTFSFVLHDLSCV